jgi:Ankyrin repeat
MILFLTFFELRQAGHQTISDILYVYLHFRTISEAGAVVNHAFSRTCDANPADSDTNTFYACFGADVPMSRTNPTASCITIWTPRCLASSSRPRRKRERNDAGSAAHWIPIHLSAYNGYLEIVKLLLERGADIHARVKHHTEYRC